MRAILFLDRHPAWSWRDLEDAPEEIVEGLRLIDAKRAAEAKKA